MSLNRMKHVAFVVVIALGLVLAGCKGDTPAKKEEAAKKEAPKAEEKAPEPGEEKPAEPVEEKPAEPAGEKPAEPVEEKPAEPADEKPAEQAADKPAEPVTEGEKTAEAKPEPPVEEKAEEKAAEEAPAADPSSAAAVKGPMKKVKRKEGRRDRARRLTESKSMVGLVGSEFGVADSMGADGLGSIGGQPMGGPAIPPVKEVPGTEDYAKVTENEFKKVVENPLSTFSIDVDTASYANMRRFIDKMSRMPPRDSVRIEEFINYFTYDYPLPDGDVPFSITTELSACPWNPKTRLAMVGLQGDRPPEEDLPPSNLVFLIDSSGSMRRPQKMDLLKAGFKLLVKNLRDKDRVAIVTYAGSAGLVLPSTPGTERDKIIAALDRLRAGGSTAGAAGIELAYGVALKSFQEKGNNRVILASDGDFNVGPASTAELERLIEEKRDKGVFLTILGFGMGNYKDSRMETLADKGNGNYAYIDDILEAKKVFVTEMTGTLYTIAKDVKIQIEFNPTKVAEYRLVGYENRMLKKEDFADDTKDAGELGAGHTVTALYELVPSLQTPKTGEELKYMKTEVKPEAAESNELMTVKLRYKEPDGDKSKLIEQPVQDLGLTLDKSSNNFRWAAAVASFGQLARESKYAGNATYGKVLEMARGARGEDRFGYRAEFIKLLEKAELIAPPPKASGVSKNACAEYEKCCHAFAEAMGKIDGMAPEAVDAAKQGCAEIGKLKALGVGAQEACVQGLTTLKQAGSAYKSIPGFEWPEICK